MPAPPRLGGYPLHDAWCWVWLLLGGVCWWVACPGLHVLASEYQLQLPIGCTLIFCVVDMCGDTFLIWD